VGKVEISIIVTVKNEEKNMSKLLESLVLQEQPIEILVIDSASTDNTCEIVKDYCERFNFVRLISHEGSRGESRNFGCQAASGDAFAFIDGDCTADRDWIKELRSSLEGYDIAAGKTVYEGKIPYGSRMALYVYGVDVSFPSCNLAYKKEAFPTFDPWFKTAEDIDLNMRAVKNGASFFYNERAIVYHNVREDIMSFAKQAFWYGFGRGQLFIKHHSLGSSSFVPKDLNLWDVFKRFFGALGLMVAVITGGETRL
jgi:glycosyltransferase involved in cell wall biosynthesis